MARHYFAAPPRSGQHPSFELLSLLANALAGQALRQSATQQIINIFAEHTITPIDRYLNGDVPIPPTIAGMIRGEFNAFAQEASK